MKNELICNSSTINCNVPWLCTGLCKETLFGKKLLPHQTILNLFIYYQVPHMFWIANKPFSSLFGVFILKLELLPLRNGQSFLGITELTQERTACGFVQVVSQVVPRSHLRHCCVFFTNNVFIITFDDGILEKIIFK